MQKYAEIKVKISFGGQNQKGQKGDFGLAGFAVLFSLKLICFLLTRHKVQKADLTCDVIKKLAPFVLSKL